MPLFPIRALSRRISSGEKLLSNLQFSLQSLKDDNALSFNLALKKYLIDKCKVLLCNQGG